MFRRMLLAVLAALTVAGAASARDPATPAPRAKTDVPHGVLVTDGSAVHDAGNLIMHTGNWGAFGSRPGGGYPFSGAPSAEWPAGSGVEYLYWGGIWVGALHNGTPRISRSWYSAWEFNPTPDSLDVVYRAAEGDPNGQRYPSSEADDDHDGLVDEDPLDGHDNDGDGWIDEDFASVSSQMFSCWYTDDQRVDYVRYDPMYLMVRENSYQWSDPDYDDFIGYDYEITNIGDWVLEDVYVAVFVDGDVGNRNTHNYWEDDMAAFRRLAIPGAEGDSCGYAFMYDDDGDDGTATGYFGAVVLDHPVDLKGLFAPARVGASVFLGYTPNSTPDDSGTPVTDRDFYDEFKAHTMTHDTPWPNDYFVVIAVGPFRVLLPGETLKFSMALVATPRDFGNVFNAVRAYRGRWFDVDGDPTTGVDGREYQAHWWLPGQEPETPAVADVHFAPQFLDPHAVGRMTARVSLPDGYRAVDVAGTTLRLNGVIPGRVENVVSEREFLASFPRDRLAEVVEPGDAEMRVSFNAANQFFVASEDVRVFDHREPVVPTALGLSRAPNPFNASVRIVFDLPIAGDATVDVFAANGERVRALASGSYPAGRHTVYWDGTDDGSRKVASGVYFCRLRSEGQMLTKKMVLAK